MPLRRLPARFAAAASAASSTAGFPATAATTAGAPAATTTATEGSATAAARSAVGFGTGLVHIQCASVQGVAIEGGNGLIRLALILHFDERETTGTSGLTIGHDSGTVHLAMLFEEAADALLGCVEIQVAYEYVLHSNLLLILIAVFLDEVTQTVTPGRVCGSLSKRDSNITRAGKGGQMKSAGTG
jgi:hypothetical protein